MAGPAEGPLAYVFFHAPGPTTAPSDYEAALRAFHEALAAHRPSGFLRSAAYRLARLPFASPSPELGGVVYADWYVVDGWGAIGRLNDAAVSPPRDAPHDRVAALAAHGSGTVLRWRQGPSTLDAPRFDRWFGKPRGVASASFLAADHRCRTPGASVWQRQLALGSAPEFVVRTRERPPGDAEGLIEVRPVVAPGGA